MFFLKRSNLSQYTVNNAEVYLESPPPILATARCFLEVLSIRLACCLIVGIRNHITRIGDQAGHRTQMTLRST
jgi:hypothetical protein